MDRDDKDMWRFYDNTRPTSFCGRNDVVFAGVNTGIDASVGTKDFIAEKGYVLQYTVSLLIFIWPIMYSQSSKSVPL